MTSAKIRTVRWGLISVILVVLAGLALMVGLIAYNRLKGAEIRSELYIPRVSKLTPETLLLQQYIRINTTNPPGNETAGARFLATHLKAAGLAPEIIESAPGRGNVYARIHGRLPGEGLLLLNHIDVVPAKGRWTRPAYSGGVAMNMMYGRGAIDMKGVGICQLEAMIALARTGRAPEHDVVFLGTADEESGGGMGVQWLLEHRPDVFSGVRYALNEGGITEMEREGVAFFGIETGSKQTTTVELAGTRPALQAARIALEPFAEPSDPDRVLEGVRRYFHAVASTRRENQETLQDIDHTLAIGKFWLIPALYRELMTNTVKPFGIETRPDGSLRMRVYLISLPDENPDVRLAWLAAKVKPMGVVIATIESKEGPAPISDDRTPFFATIVRVVRKHLGPIPIGPVVLGLASNDSRFLRARGITCYGVQPFRADFFQSLSIHDADERVRLDWFTDGVALMRSLVSAFAFGEG